MLYHRYSQELFTTFFGKLLSLVVTMNEESKEISAELKLKLKGEVEELANQYYDSIEKTFKKKEQKYKFRLWVIRILPAVVFVIYLILNTLFPETFPRPFREMYELFLFILSDYLVLYVPESVIYNEGNVMNLADAGILIRILSLLGIVMLMLVTYNLIMQFPHSIRLRRDILIFCYINNTIREIKSFLTNNIEEHLEVAQKKISAYLEISETGEIIRSEVYKSIYRFIENYFWFKISKESEIVSSAYKNFNSKILERINLRIELDKIVPALNDLMLYEYSKIKKPKEDKLSIDLLTVTEVGKLCLYDFAEKTNELTAVEKEEQLSSMKVIFRYIIDFLPKLATLLRSEDPIRRYFSWVAILSLIIDPLIIGSIYLLGGKLTETTLITIMLSPFIIAGVSIGLFYRKI